MKRHLLAISVVFFLMAGTAVAGDYIVPAFAFNLQGHGKNLWTSEIYLANPGQSPVIVDPPTVLRGGVVLPAQTCLPPMRQLVVEPHSSLVWKAEDIAREMGCAVEIVGALEFRTDGPLSVGSRMINRAHVASTSTMAAPLSGFSQELPGVDIANLPPAGQGLMLPTMIWDQNSCAPPKFDSYVGFANPSDEVVHVTLSLSPALNADAIMLGGSEVQLPAVVELAPDSWQQVHVAPVVPQGDECSEPQVFDLFLDADGPVAVYGSVVDRATQDPRTVAPLELR
ncbi:MAG: hypothetical protein LJE95_05280 [Acidobacteria bacterium]|nr:hypothetical protein [Acidobacteriota bacterium]